MKDLIIKVWPEIQGYLPAILPWQNIKEKKQSIFIDFTNCVSVDSSGLALLLIRCIKLIESDKKKRKWKSHDINMNDAFRKVIDLNFFNILNEYNPSEMLFVDKEFKKYHNNVVVSVDEFGIETISIPIHCINFKKHLRRRDGLKDFREWIRDNLDRYATDYNINLNQIMLILNEIAKNTADHTLGDGFIGLDIKTDRSKEIIKIEFAIGDLGVGINNNIKDTLPDNMIKRFAFWDLTQTYLFALKEYATTKTDSNFNKGIGMNIITSGAKNVGLELSVFDAKSRGLLNEIKKLSHKNVRENFFNIGRPVGFYYFGKIKANKVG
ncbi:MAG: hypothetical protein JEZ11_05210 [Desulfobacterales bacterium]|nr:hypothetical protein [Desulfobacterales bacterium]